MPQVNWTDECRFLLHMTDGRTRVWRQLNAASNIQETIPFGDGSVMVWECVSLDCKLNLDNVQGSLDWQRCQRDVLQTAVPHFDNHAVATRPVFMNDNARPHRTPAVMDCLQ